MSQSRCTCFFFCLQGFREIFARHFGRRKNNHPELLFLLDKPEAQGLFSLNTCLIIPMKKLTDMMSDRALLDGLKSMDEI